MENTTSSPEMVAPERYSTVVQKEIVSKTKVWRLGESMCDTFNILEGPEGKKNCIPQHDDYDN